MAARQPGPDHPSEARPSGAKVKLAGSRFALDQTVHPTFIDANGVKTALGTATTDGTGARALRSP